MSRRYLLPRCMTILPSGNECRREMRPLREADPSFGPNYKPGVWVFRCGYCGGMRAVDKTLLGRYFQPA
jgi:hypothetical protein